MPAYTAAQKDAIDQFVDLTGCQRSVASKYLRPVGWNVERAIDGFYGDNYISPSEQLLGEIFDLYRDDPKESPDVIGIDGAMRFLENIQVQLDEVACLAVFEMCQSPSMGEFTRKEFINGWRNARCTDEDKMRDHVKYLRNTAPTNPELFRRVYRYAFPLSRMQGQRNLTFEIAVDQWRLFFTADHGGIKWNTSTTPWLDWWIEFLESRGKKPVSKDLWEQVEVFMRKTREDEEFSWWSEDGAWPGALDDFVVWVKEKRAKGSEMEIE